MKHGATYHDFNVMVWHDTTARTGANAADEHLYHSGKEADAMAKRLKRLYPGDRVAVISRQEHDASRRVDEAYSQQDCS